MNKTKSLYSEEGDDLVSSLDQKIQYLEKLFQAIEKEQSNLLAFLKSEKVINGRDEDKMYKDFIQNINNVESSIRTGYQNLQAKKYKEAKTDYDQSLTLITPYIAHTKLFHPLIIEIRTKRAQACFGMDGFNDCLVDTTYLLEQERLGESAPMTTITVLKLHSKALMKLGRNDEANESLGKLSILSPEDDEVTTLMESLQV